MNPQSPLPTEVRLQDVPEGKKPYIKPAVVFERELEAVAAVCDPGGQPRGKAEVGETCQIAFS